MPIKNNPYKVITAEMVIGLKYHPDEQQPEFSFINGLIKRRKRVYRAGLFALGNYQPQDIGKRVYNSYVENDLQVHCRTGLSMLQRKKEGRAAIEAAREKYKGHEDIWGGTIQPEN